jgi:hypothetical protein
MIDSEKETGVLEEMILEGVKFERAVKFVRDSLKNGTAPNEYLELVQQLDKLYGWLLQTNNFTAGSFYLRSKRHD